MQIKKIKIYHILIVLILLLAFGVRSYRVMEKDSLFMDENFSIILANYGPYGFTWPVVAAADEVKTYEGGELKERIYSDDNSLSNVVYDIWNLRKSTRDTAHPSLYYSLLRLSFWGTDTANLDDVVGRAFMLNSLLFILGFFFLYRLSRLFFGDNWILICCVLALAALNPISISNTLFMRSYQLQEAMFIIFTYFVVRVGKRMNDNISLFSGKGDVIGLVLSASLFLSSGYFGAPYVLMMWTGLALYVLVKGQNKPRQLGKLAVTLIGAVILTFLIYPSYLDGLFGGRGEEAMGRLSVSEVLSGFGHVFPAMGSIIGVGVLVALVVLLLISILVLVNSKKIFEYRRISLLFIVGCIIIWMLLAFYLAPVKEVRYIAPVFPLLYLIFPLFLSLLANKTVQSISAALLVCFFLFKSFTTQNIYWGKVEVGDYYKNDISTPLILGGIFSPWLQTSLTPYFTEGRTIIFTFSMDEFEQEIGKYNEAYIILGGEGMDEFFIPEGYETVSEPVFDGERVEALGGRYKIKRKDIIL